MLKHKNVVPLLFSFSFIAVFLAAFDVVSWHWLFLILLLWLAITSWGAFDIRRSYFTTVFYKKVRHDGKSVALTFDDGPTALTAEFLDILKEHDARATFFCVGKQIEQYPLLFDRILQEGHCVGNHTMNHKRSFGFLTTEQVVEEIEKCDAIFEKYYAVKTRLFRPPFGLTNPSIAKAVKHTKHQVIGWNNRSLDTVLGDDDKIYRRVCDRLQAGDIVLFHDRNRSSLKALQKTLAYMKEQHLHAVTVDELLNLEAYES